MDYGQGIEQKIRQTLAMTPVQLQNLEILAMGNQELMQFLEDEQMENPMLDYETCSAAGDEYIVLGEWFRKNDYTEHDDRSAVNEDMSLREVAGKETFSLREYLKSQIPHTSSSEKFEKGYGKEHNPEQKRKEEAVVNSLLEYIDERTGYFGEPEEYLKCIMKCPKDTFDKALSMIRKMEPAGIGAFGLSDCLKLQLERTGIEDDLLIKIIDSFLEDVASGNIKHISRNLKVPTEKVKRCIRIIKNLNPRPAKGFGTDDTVYVIPDMKAVKDKNGWEVTIRNSKTSHIRLNSMYMQIAQNSSEPDLRTYFEEKITRAKNIIKAIEQRDATIRQVVLCVLKYQEGYAIGLTKRSQLTMKQVAEELDIHPSTVTRAVKDKYIELPSGVFALKDLFQASREASWQTGWMTETEKGEPEQEKMIHMIQKLVDDEDKNRPLSDQKISEELESRGIIIARRTVAKYREIAGIGNASERKVK